MTRIRNRLKKWNTNTCHTPKLRGKETSDNEPVVMCLPQTNHRFLSLLGAFSPFFLEQRASGKKPPCSTSAEILFRQPFCRNKNQKKKTHWHQRNSAWLQALATNSNMGPIILTIHLHNVLLISFYFHFVWQGPPQHTCWERKTSPKGEDSGERSEKKKNKGAKKKRARRNQKSKKKNGKRKAFRTHASGPLFRKDRRERRRNRQKKKTNKKTRKRNKKKRKECWPVTCSLSGEPYDAMTYSP